MKLITYLLFFIPLFIFSQNYDLQLIKKLNVKSISLISEMDTVKFYKFNENRNLITEIENNFTFTSYKYNLKGNVIFKKEFYLNQKNKMPKLSCQTNYTYFQNNLDCISVKLPQKNKIDYL